MDDRLTLVLDIGKTNAKISLWNRAGACVARKVRANSAGVGADYPSLDLEGLEGFVASSVREMATLGPIGRVVPVTHGAAAVLMREGRPFLPPMDYEVDIPADVRRAYEAERDAFSATGSPFLPQGLNLGAQLFYLEALSGPWPQDVQILPWPQFWAFRFSGVAASEATSLGCHTDLWLPLEGAYSELAERRGWAERFAPLRRAQEVLGRVTAEWIEAGLPADCEVLCGLHDSNSALLAARGHAEIALNDATVLSTGTWFVAMRSLGADARPPKLDAGRDCLINVDVRGLAAPSARFMGGRESELIAGLDSFHITDNYDPQAILPLLPDLIAADSMVLPSFAPGFGPFPDHKGVFLNPPQTLEEKRAVLGLYLALMADVALDLIGARDRILVEGRFAEAEVFVRALASLRKDAQVYVSNAHNDVPFGALRLVFPDLAPKSALRRVAPLDLSLDLYQALWRRRVSSTI